MPIRHQNIKMLAVLLLSVFITGTSVFGATDAEALKRLERLIEQQQARIEAQARAIEELKQQVYSLSRQTEKGSATKPAATQKDTGVKSASDKVNVTLYGQVNRGVLYSNDGNDSYFYHVDNDNSSTRIGLLGKGNINSDISAGTRIEVEFQANASNEVNQNSQNGVGDNHFKKRHLDLFFQSKRYGKLSLGWGNTASNETSEVDLSGTTVIGYSSIADMAGGQLFYDAAAGSLSATKIGSVWTNMDGLGRDDRIRYDTPSFYGLEAAVSNISGGANDIALRYSSKLGTVKLAAAAAYASLGSTSTSVDNRLNGSVSALHDSGINLTFAAGSQNMSATGRDDGSFYYGKLGYQAKFFNVGKTKFAFDYGRAMNINMDDDEFDTIGAVGVQDFTDWGTEFYLGYRYHKLDRNAADYDDINAILSGFRVKF